MMETELVSKTLVFNLTLTRLIAQENFTALCMFLLPHSNLSSQLLMQCIQYTCHPLTAPVKIMHSDEVQLKLIRSTHKHVNTHRHAQLAVLR
jgi:hypothetical protein